MTRCRLYPVTPELEPATLAARVTLALAAGVRTVQLRQKARVVSDDEGRALVTLCHRAGAFLIVNDDPELAVRWDADGVHVGPNDRSPQEARRIVGEGRLVGASAGTLEAARAQVLAGADYLGVGAIFDASPTKPDATHHRGTGLLRVLREDAVVGRVPLVAIGGIDASNAAACLAAGASGVAVVRALLGDADPAAAVARFVAAGVKP